ncbi:hypothetical protein D3C71_276520 [compost metagenome]
MTALELYIQGRPIKSIARALGVSCSYVGKLLRASGYIPYRIGGTRLTSDQVEKASEMHKAGYSWRAISLEIGAADKTIKRAVELCNIRHFQTDIT